MNEPQNELTYSAREASKLRQGFADYLDQTSALLKASGLAGLNKYVKTLSDKAEALRHEVFRILVLGDFNRGKSTLLNAIIGKELLPTEVIPCTAVLTKVKYGMESRIAVHFKSKLQAPETFHSFRDFGAKYSIPKGRGQSLEGDEQTSFPHIAYAEIEQNVDLLANGVEFIDSPGLSRSDGDNELTLDSIKDSQAILFLLDAPGQLLSQSDCSYLKDYLYSYLTGLGSRLPKVFFVLNQWDLIAKKCLHPEDISEVKAAEAEVKNYFERRLAKELNLSVEQLQRFWGERIFTTSALQELQKSIGTRMEQGETGVPKLRQALGKFLTEDRLQTEVGDALTEIIIASAQAISQLERVYNNLREGKLALEEKLNQAALGCEKLASIISELESFVTGTQSSVAHRIADNFRSNLMHIANSFEVDFVEPALPGGLATKAKMEAYRDAVVNECVRHLNEKMRIWEKQTTSLLEDELNVLTIRVIDKARVYEKEKTKIDAILVRRSVDSASTLNWKSRIGSPNLSMSGNSLRINASFALSNTIGAITGLSVGSLAASAIAQIFHGAVFGPVGVAVTLGAAILLTFQANRAQKLSIKDEILKKARLKIQSEASEKFGAVYAGVRVVFQQFFTFIENLKQDLQVLSEGINSLKFNKDLTQDEAIREEKRLEQFLNNLSEYQTNAMKTFEEAFGIKVTEAEIENMLRRKAEAEALSSTRIGHSTGKQPQVLHSKDVYISDDGWWSKFKRKVFNQ